MAAFSLSKKYGIFGSNSIQNEMEHDDSKKIYFYQSNILSQPSKSPAMKMLIGVPLHSSYCVLSLEKSLASFTLKEIAVVPFRHGD